MDIKESIILLTDKTGRRDRTDDIKEISLNPSKTLWNVTFLDNPEPFHYKPENVQIIKNCLKDKKSATVFEYLMQMAHFSDLSELLVKKMEDANFLDEQTVLAKYLNPKRYELKTRNEQSFIFPFGCNSSQLQAVKTAINNSISIIQGPPGTGKTQTILNIIANLLIKEKTVLVVSNNNSATANVLEKLSSDEYGLGFICATHGKKENVDNFLLNQKEDYPEYLKKDWVHTFTEEQRYIDQEINRLEQYFKDKERIARIKAELSSLEIEIKYFRKETIELPKYNIKKLLQLSADDILFLLDKLQFKYSEKEKIGFFTKLALKTKYGLGEKKFWLTNPEQVFYTIKDTFYLKKNEELINELKEKTLFVGQIDPKRTYEKCKAILRKSIAKHYEKNGKRIQFKSNAFIYHYPHLFVKEYPVVLSTTFSSRATLGSCSDFLYDYVIMDEASQVDLVTGALAISCARNAVIVGDKKQLPNVIEENKKEIFENIFTKTNLEPGYSYLNSFLNSLEMILPETPQTLLREHYRCHPKIINFCNLQFYGGKLLIMTEDNGEKDVLEAIRTKPGNFCKDHYNQRQIDVIKDEILPKYTEDEIANLGIIAPYNKQTDALRSQIPGIDSSTVHKYQGREKDNIIISTVDNEITSFADDSNMLNVAISRAKKKLAIVLSGNKQPENSNLIALLKYIQYNNFTVEDSKVNSIFDFFYTKDTEAKFKYLKSANKISKYDSENAMNSLLTQIFEEAKYSKFSFVFEMPLKEVINKKFIGELPEELAIYANSSWAHVDFTVFNRVTKEILFGIEVDGYNYHKKGTKQAERDQKKNTIFEMIGLPLLRLSTKGSGEEQKIKAQLDCYLEKES